jgi:hypothetical protein
MKELIVGYVANNADTLAPDEMCEMLKRLSGLQESSVRAYNSLLSAVEGG